MSSSLPSPLTENSSLAAPAPSRAARRGRTRLQSLAEAFRNREEGAATAEYAVATMAAVGFAGLLVVILRSDEVRAILTELVRNALTFTG